MAGAGYGGTNPVEGGADEMGVRGLSAMGNIGLPALGTAAMIGGSFLPGVGRMIGGLDPLSQGLGGFARGAGLRSGGMGVMGNLGRIAQGGIGSIARAGIGGVAGGLMAAAAPMAIGAGLQYGVGQMVQGAQYQGQVQNFLGSQFRFTNPQSESGFGFSREQSGGIADMMRTMGHQDMMSSPQELLRVAKAGTGMGMFRAVQDVKEFKTRFQDMVKSLKEISTTMNTTLEGALPFFQQARQMGFWTPQDIVKSAQMARQTAGATGMSVAQTQQMMAQGAGMARQVGAEGWTGAAGMAKTMQFVGGAVRGGAVSEQQMSEATGGLQGSEAIQSMAGTLQAATTRFAASGTARWLLAGLGRDKFSRLDTGALQRFTQGGMRLGEIGGQARGNIGKQGAFNFVMNEQNLRGELIKQGPEAQLGLIRTLVGPSMYGEGARDQYVTRRLMSRYFGTSARQSDMLAEMAREAPRIMQENEARGASSLDQEMRNRDEVMNRSWEGVKRQASKWFDQNVKDPLQKFGAEMSRGIAHFYEHATDKFWGATPMRHRVRGIGGSEMRALQQGAMGDTTQMEVMFGRPGQYEKQYGAMGSGLGLVGQGATRSFQGMGALAGAQNMLSNALPGMFGGGEFTNRRIETLRKMGVGEYAFNTAEERERANREQGLVSGAERGGAMKFTRRGGAMGFLFGGGTTEEQNRFRSMSKADIEQAEQGAFAAASGKFGERGAKALGFSSMETGAKAIKAAQEEMNDNTYQMAAARLAHTTGLQGRDLANAMVREIQQGRVGGANLRALVSGTKDRQQQANRLMAAQTGEQRGRFGAMDVTGELEGLGVTGLMAGIEGAEKILGQRMEGAEKALAEGMTERGRMVQGMGIRGAGTMVEVGGRHVSPDTIRKLQGKKEFQDLARWTNYEPKTPEEKAKKEKAISDLSTKLMTMSDKDLSKEEREVVSRLTDPKDPKYKESQGLLAALGGVHQDKSRLAFTETLTRRRERMIESMGDQKEAVLTAFDAVKGGGGRSVGQIVRELVDDTGAHPEVVMNRVKELVQASGQADPEKMAEVAQIIKNVPGAEMLSTAVQGGMMATALTKRGRGGLIDDPKRAMGAFHALTGIKISRETMKALTGSDAAAADAARKNILDPMSDPVAKQNADEIMGAIRDKNPQKLLELMQSRVVARSLGQLGDPKNNILYDSVNKLRNNAGDTAGQAIGSPKGQHLTLLRMLEQLTMINNNNKIDVVDNPKEKPPS